MEPGDSNWTDDVPRQRRKSAEVEIVFNDAFSLGRQGHVTTF